MRAVLDETRDWLDVEAHKRELEERKVELQENPNDQILIRYISDLEGYIAILEGGSPEIIDRNQ